jgi:hypothetical protein
LISAFFAWLFAPAVRDNPELLADPLKQVAPALEAWKDPNGPLKMLLDELRRYPQDQTVQISFNFEVEERIDSRSSVLLGSIRTEPTPIKIADLSKPQIVESLIRDLVILRLPEAEARLKRQKAYVDLKYQDKVRISIDARFSQPLSSFGEEFADLGPYINTIQVIQCLSNSSKGRKEPGLHHYT